LTKGVTIIHNLWIPVSDTMIETCAKSNLFALS